MKVLHVCYSDSREGGAIGAYRLHTSMLREGIDSKLLVVRKRNEDSSVLRISLPFRGINILERKLSNLIIKILKPADQSFHSLNIFPTGIHRLINKQDADVVQLHWINRNAISIKEIGKIRSPVVWKFPDMWAFSGAEHYLSPGDPERYREGYNKENRPVRERGPDLDRWLWKYKMNVWKDMQLTIVCPSKWLAKCAQRSAMFRKNKIVNIANPINFDIYKPFTSKSAARKILGLPEGKSLILFGGINAVGDRRKGFHLLEKCLSHLASKKESGDFELVVFGASGEPGSTLHGMRVHYLGNLFRDDLMRAAYSSADVMVLPTKADNLPNTIQEATCCGIPCVGFEVGGLPDMIKHKETGYLAEPFDTRDLATGISWVLENKGETLSRRVRKNAEQLFDPKKRVADYVEIYRDLLQQKEKN